MSKMIIELDADTKITKLFHDGKGHFGEIHLDDVKKIGDITRIDHATVIYHKANPTGKQCVTVIINGVPHRV